MEILIKYAKLNAFFKFEKRCFTTSNFNTKLKYKFKSAVVSIPHFSKKQKGGEDSHATHEGMICVADGVGGWNEVGVDPSLYSKELCKNFLDEYIKNGFKFFSQPIKLFVNACDRTTAKGSATFSMCMLDFEKEYLHTLNMGDSGYMIVRSKNNIAKHNSNPALNKIMENKFGDTSSFPIDIVYKSQEQQKGFNFPYQVGTGGDDPEEAQVNVHGLMENDVIVLATDGLWDNLYEYDILKIIKPFMETSEEINDLGVVCQMIGEICEKYSLNQRYRSPFSMRSRGLYLGGKPDDITIVLAQIVKNDI